MHCMIDGMSSSKRRQSNRQGDATGAAGSTGNGDASKINPAMWRAKFIQWIASGRLRSEDIASQASQYLESWGEAPVSTAAVNHFRSSRYPRTDRLFSSLVWALDDLGVWDEVDGTTRQTEIADWGTLIGKSLTPDRPIVPLPPTASGRVALRRFLTRMTDQQVNRTRPPVIQVFSSTPFLAGLEPGIARAIAACAEVGILVLFVFEPNWEYSARWRDDLADMLLSRLPLQSAARKALFCVTLPSNQIDNGGNPVSRAGSLAELWVRLGLYTVPTTASVNLQSGELTIKYLTTLDVGRAWIYFEPSQSASGTPAGEAALLEDKNTPRVRALWRSVPDDNQHTPQLLESLLTKKGSS